MQAEFFIFVEGSFVVGDRKKRIILWRYAQAWADERPRERVAELHCEGERISRRVRLKLVAELGECTLAHVVLGAVSHHERRTFKHLRVNFAEQSLYRCVDTPE